MAPVERVDAVVDGDELGMALAEELQALAPFGRGNPGVSLMVADATFGDVRPMGEGKHARFTVRSGGARARAVAFGTGGRCRSPRASRRRRRSRWRSTSGTASASRDWCSAARGPRTALESMAPERRRSAEVGRSAEQRAPSEELVLFA